MYSNQSIWYNYSNYFGHPNLLWCEKITDNVFATYFNTISNLSYVFVGLKIIHENYTINSTITYYGLSCIVLGLLSGLYHASLVWPLQIGDFIGMNILLSVMLSINLCNNLNYFIINFIISNSLLLSFILLNLHIQLMILPFIFLIIFTSRYNYYFKKTIKYMLMAGFCSFVDINNIICYPNSIIQGHSLWHLFSGISLYYWYKHII